MRKDVSKKVVILTDTNSENIEQIILILKDFTSHSEASIIKQAEKIVADYERQHFGSCPSFVKVSTAINGTVNKKSSKSALLTSCVWIGGIIFSLAVWVGVFWFVFKL